MAAPSFTARSTPSGAPLRDGYRALIAFANDANILFWEKAVTPPGLDGGEPIDDTTMHNNVYRTMSSSALITMTQMSTRVAWDVTLYSSILALINVEQAITVFFSTGRKMAFYGFLRTFEPGEMVEGQQPEATINIQPTNRDPSTFGEESPVLGTGT